MDIFRNAFVSLKQGSLINWRLIQILSCPLPGKYHHLVHILKKMIFYFNKQTSCILSFIILTLTFYPYLNDISRNSEELAAVKILSRIIFVSKTKNSLSIFYGHSHPFRMEGFFTLSFVIDKVEYVLMDHKFFDNQ